MSLSSKWLACVCGECGGDAERLDVLVACSGCSAKKVAEQKARLVQDCRESWQGLTPQELRAEDDGRNAGNGAAVAFLRHFKGNPGKGSGGFIFGGSRAGKSWLAFHCLKKPLWHRLGVRVERAVMLSDLLTAQSFKAEDKRAECLKAMRSAGVLLLDDVDKLELEAEAVSRALLDVVDWRLTHGAATLFTSNTSIEELTGRFHPRHGVALAARIGEHCQMIELDGNKKQKER